MMQPEKGVAPAMFDVVMPVADQHKEIATLSIQMLIGQIAPRRVYILTARNNFHFFETLQKNDRIVLLDEDALIPGVRLESVADFIEKAGGKRSRAGWYFQQFIKMAACFLPDIAGHYLIWDADTLMLHPVHFLDDRHQVLVKPSSEYHQPYFDTYERILGLTRSVDFSFISEHLFVNTEYMKELIAAIEAHSEPGRPWVWCIMNAIDPMQLSSSGFSEYETYGNFVNTVHPGAFALRPLETIRYAARKFGPIPNRYDLYRLYRSYAFASFESWETTFSLRIRAEKCLSFLFYYFCPARYFRGRHFLPPQPVNGQ